MYEMKIHDQNVNAGKKTFSNTKTETIMLTMTSMKVFLLHI